MHDAKNRVRADKVPRIDGCAAMRRIAGELVRIVICRFTGTRTISESAERRAQKWVGSGSGASSVSEMLGGAESRKTPPTVDNWFETRLSTASLSSALRWACSKTSVPTIGSIAAGAAIPIIGGT